MTRLTRRSLLSVSAKLAAGLGAGAALAACGTTLTPQVVEKIVEGTPQVVVETVVVEKEVTVQVAAAEKIVLRYLYDETPGETAMHKINKVDYEAANPGVEIKPEPTTESWVEKTLAAVVAGTAPDILMGWADVFISFSSRGVMEDITDAVSTWPDIDDFWPASLREVGIVEGRTYGIPYCFDPVTIVYYHKSKFDEVGASYPDDAWTYDDMLQYAVAMTKLDDAGDPIQWGFNGAETISTWGWQRALPAVYAYGGKKYSDDMRNCLLAEPEALEAFNIFYEMKVKHKASPTPAQAGDLSYYQMFASGTCCFQTTGPWAIGTYQQMIQDEALKNQWAVGAPPRGPEARYVWAVGNNWGIWKGGAHKPEALALLQFLTDKDREVLVANTGRRVPARQSAADAFVVSGMPDNQIVFPLSLEYAVTPSTHPTKESQIGDLLAAAWESVVITEEKTPEEAMSAVVLEVDKLLQEA